MNDLQQQFKTGLETLKSKTISIKERFVGGIGMAQEFVREHPVTSAVTVGGGILVASQIIRVVRKKRKGVPKIKKRAVRKVVGKRGKRDYKFISKQKHEIAYQKRRKKLGKKTYGKKYKTPTSKKGKWVSFTTKQGKKVRFRTK